VRMTDGGFLSTATVVVIVACIALLAMLSALTLAPLDSRLGRRRYVVAFAVCLAAIWAVAVLGIALIRRSI
jgi:MFS-type transporter involved in bile tolerance (Atg22 family)